MKIISRTAWINMILCTLILILCSTIGFLIYAKYRSCDPLKAKLVGKSDQVGEQQKKQMIYLRLNRKRKIRILL